MNTVSEIYADAVHQNLRPLFANWEPGQPVKVGDYGTLSRNAFTHVGNIGEIGISFRTREDPTTDCKAFTTRGSTEIVSNAKGSVNLEGQVRATASLDVKFLRDNAVFFNAAECRCTMMEDVESVGREIMKSFRANKWEKAWVVVTEIVSAGATTVAISGGKNASLALEAKGQAEKIDLTDASVGLKASGQRNVGYIVCTASGLIPLLGLARIQTPFPWLRDKFAPLG